MVGAENDPGAPYGRKADGTPKKGPGGRPTGKPRAGTRRRTTPRATSRPAAPSKNRKPTTPRSKPADYTDTAEGLVQLLAGGVSVAAKMLGATQLAEDLQLDALTLHLRARDAAELVNESAQELPWLGATLDKWNAYTPWAKPTMFLAGLAAQIAVNHRRVPPGTMGSVSREELMMMAMAAAPETPEPAPAPASPPESSTEPAPAEADTSNADWRDPNGFPATNISDLHHPHPITFP